MTSADPKSGRPLKPDFFQWSANTITRIFRGCQTAEKFVAVWKREIVPYLNPKNGELDVRTMKLSQQTNESTRNNRKRPATDSGICDAFFLLLLETLSCFYTSRATGNYKKDERCYRN